MEDMEGRRMVSGLKCSSNTVNYPGKAWSQIFTIAILSNIVTNTNEYDELHCPNWVHFTNTDLTEFISILFITAIQKIKYRTRNWWSQDPLWGNKIFHKIMSGKQLHRFLRYLHV